VHNTWDLEHLELIDDSDTHEDVSRKEWQIKGNTPILPATNGTVEWQKVFNGHGIELGSDVLFVICAGVGRVPMRLGERIFRRLLLS